MTTCFKPCGNSAFDEASGISIPRPRILPAGSSNDGSRLEYQYIFRRNGERVAAIGFFGTVENVMRDGSMVRVYTMQLRPAVVIDSLLRIQAAAANTDDQFTFVRCSAQGLVNAYLAGHDNDVDCQYRAVTTIEVLGEAGVAVPAGHCADVNGTLTLAEVFVPSATAADGHAEARP